MSHIPAAAMPHAGPHAEPDAGPARPDAPRAKPGWGLVAALVGGVVALGAAAAVPLLHGRSAPKRARRERKAARSARAK